MNYNQTKEWLKNELNEDLKKGINLLLKSLKRTSDVFDDVIIQLGRYNQTEKDSNRNIIDDTVRYKNLDQIRVAVISVINSINANDLMINENIHGDDIFGSIDSMNNRFRTFQKEYDKYKSWIIQNSGLFETRREYTDLFEEYPGFHSYEQKVIEKHHSYRILIFGTLVNIRFFNELIIDWKPMTKEEEFPPFKTVNKYYHDIRFNLKEIKNAKLKQDIDKKKGTIHLIEINCDEFSSGITEICETIEEQVIHFDENGKEDEGILGDPYKHDRSTTLNRSLLVPNERVGKRIIKGLKKLIEICQEIDFK